MSPNTSGGAIDHAEDTSAEALDAELSQYTKREQLNVLTQETRFTLIQNILAHPKQLPSLKELDYYNPSKSKSTIRNHLEKLIKYDLVKECSLSNDDRTRDLPWKFYGLTDRATELLQSAELLDAEETLQEIYELLELTDEIVKYAEAPRPSRDNPISALENRIRDVKSNTASVEDQILIIQAMYDAEIGPNQEGITRTKLKESISDNTSYTLRTSLNHLEDLGLVETITPAGPGIYVISERLDEIINGRVEEVATGDLENLIAHMEDEIYSVDLDDIKSGNVVTIADGAGTTIRAILAKEFGIDPEAVEAYLREGDTIDRLNAAIDAIETSDQVGSRTEYGRILFRRPANRYRLTEDAIEVIENRG